MSKLVIKNLWVSVKQTKILKGVDLMIESGKIHVLMGPNGSGKSTLAYTLMGHPAYTVLKTKSQKDNPTIELDGKDLLGLKPHQRARLGLLLAFQNPVAVQGVPITNLLRTADRELHPAQKNLTVRDFNRQLGDDAKSLGLDKLFLKRSLNIGFSGGEKKKLEMLQVLALKPKFVIFDEIDTGLDVDALKLVAEGIDRAVEMGAGVLLITHYQRILRYLRPSQVHVMVDGQIVASGGADLAREVEKKGYRVFE